LADGIYAIIVISML